MGIMDTPIHRAIKRSGGIFLTMLNKINDPCSAGGIRKSLMVRISFLPAGVQCFLPSSLFFIGLV